MSQTCYNVIVDGGAKGDGVTDDTVAIQTAIDQTPEGGSLCFPFPPAYYLITKALTVKKGIRISGQKSPIVQKSINTAGFSVTASRVSIRGLKLTGVQNAALAGNERAIWFQGPNGASPLINIEVFDCDLDTWGMYGIYAQYVQRFRFNKNNVTNIAYGGIAVLSGQYGFITENYVDTVTATPNAYGIFLTRNSAAVNELISDPLTTNVTVFGNHVLNIPHWEAYDTHGGRDIQFVGNQATNCLRGIAIGQCPNKTGAACYAPKYCVAIGNTLDSGVSDGSASYGINVTGAIITLGSPVDYAEGCQVIGNTVKGYGAQGSGTGMAYFFQATKGLSCHGNSALESGHCAFGFYTDNDGFSCVGNTAQDVWSNVGPTSAGIQLISDYNKGIIDNCKFVAGAKTAPYKNDYGIEIANWPHNQVALGKNYSEFNLSVYSYVALIV